jgi:hypothetical protein
MSDVVSRAVIIGVPNYAEGSDLASHPEIAASARMYGIALEADEAHWRQRYRVLSPDEVETPMGMMAALEAASEPTEPDDVFMVIYVGHGGYWVENRDTSVHFAVGSSRQSRPWTWLSCSFVYEVMDKAAARLKVLIADCCYSNQLPGLGPEEVEKAFSEPPRGTLVLTPLSTRIRAEAVGCKYLSGDLANCTAFSGHVLEVLGMGTTDQTDGLNAAQLSEAVYNRVTNCPSRRHDKPTTLRRDRVDAVPLFTNHMVREKRTSPPPLSGAEQWRDHLAQNQQADISDLLRFPDMAGEVVALLYGTGDQAKRIAFRINEEAAAEYANAAAFARYWNQAGRVLR